jgi:hypothetical protein
MQPLLQRKSNKYYTTCVCVCVRIFVALGSPHAMRMHHVVICGLCGTTVFFNIIS